MLYLFIWLLCGFAAAAIYKGKGRSGGTAFLVGLIFGPIGVLLALLSSTDSASLERQQLTTGQAKKCPHCAEMIRPEATICRFCHQSLVATAPAVAPSTDTARIVPNGLGGFVCSACGGGIRDDATECKHCHRRVFMPAATYAGLAKE